MLKRHICRNRYMFVYNDTWMKESEILILNEPLTWSRSHGIVFIFSFLRIAESIAAHFSSGVRANKSNFCCVLSDRQFYRNSCLLRPVIIWTHTHYTVQFRFRAHWCVQCSLNVLENWHQGIIRSIWDNGCLLFYLQSSKANNQRRSDHILVQFDKIDVVVK